ncbi:rifin PIR protein, putative [Plasmodium reichenowi]|uniref:Rifin PIR protein, putative n=1 Tax=Plasmodium reichenowi TaxID=5854 RepID=A0A2P9D4C2_PLARE|nr:rifin PIR protein, putative [Plasmodium reichenowi]
MKVHYFNILLFALPLNILEHNQRNHKNTTQHTQTNRSLCECELYMPNYDNDPQMKAVMENFNNQAQQRFHEYNGRIQSKRMQCKEQCDKEVQKIILKDKLEKELMDKFATLQTDIQSDSIPTCICEKSMADKMEKGCLRCGYGLGTVAPTVGLIGSVAVNVWKNTLIDVAIKLAKEEGIQAGVKAAIVQMKDFPGLRKIVSINWSDFINGINYNSTRGLLEAANSAMASIGKPCTTHSSELACSALSKGEISFRPVVAHAEYAYTTKVAAAKTAKKGVIEAAIYDWYGTVGYSVLAIIIIVLIMVIIYLILRHRRKRKMKKKLQYIKLLEE